MRPDNYMAESAKLYIEQYGNRLASFVDTFEATAEDFVSREIKKFSEAMNDFEYYSNNPGMAYDFGAPEGYWMATEAVDILGYETVYYSNKRKIEFLKQRAAQVAGLQIATSHDNSSSQDDDSILAAIRSMKAKAVVPGTPMEDIVNHFLPMTEVKADNGEPLLTKGQLSAFLKRGFLKDEAQPKQKINCPSRKKGFVVKRFYEFYKKAKNDYAVIDRREPFIDLFMDCFDNWDRSTVKSLFRGNKSRNNWG